ncbi:MAG: MipA/OmpV family protein, partial [Gammaproteobacteria bacterium]|nr:MipA/OmpV family protein [Gammaproteobacteria bacterium]
MPKTILLRLSVTEITAWTTCLLLLLLSGSVLAQAELPRLELGAGLFALDAPDYRGSEESSTYLLPVPYIKYRGDVLRIDEGVQGVVFESPDWLFTLSADFSLPADDDTPEREGMEEIDAVFEIGPSLNYRIMALQNSAWWIDLPLRFVYAIDSKHEFIGRVFQPRLSWRKPANRLDEWKLHFLIGPVYSNDEHHAYFYSVGDNEVTATRPAYDADAG